MSTLSTEQVDIVCLCNRHGVGGAPLNAGLLAVEFSRRGYTTELGFLFERDPDARHGTNSFFVVAEDFPRGPGALKAFVAGLKREVVDRKPKAIVGFQPTANIVGAFAASLVRHCTMVATQRNPSNQQSKSAGFLEKAVGRTPLYSANIAVSDTVKRSFNHYPQKYREKLAVVHNATPDLPEVDDDQIACRQRFGMPTSGLVLGCLGRLHPQKNLAFAIQVAREVPHATLYLAGDGPDAHSLKTQVTELGLQERVRFLGSVSGADVTRFYRALDALLFPSAYEGFGRVLVEAMSQGVPVVASDIPIVREVGGEAAITRPLDVTAWREAIYAVTGDPDLASRLAVLGRERSASFGLPAMVDGYLAAAGLPLWAPNVPENAAQRMLDS
jgi:glycosyltransferase involved in cell wall biosynthesis